MSTAVGATLVEFLALCAHHAREFVARRPGVLAGRRVAASGLALVCAPDGDLTLVVSGRDGERVERGAVVMTVEGGARAGPLATMSRLAEI